LRSPHHERQRVRCFDSGRRNLFRGRRIAPSLRFLNAIERQHDKALGRSSIEAGYFLGTYDVMTAGSRHCGRRRFIDNAGLKAVSVFYAVLWRKRHKPFGKWFLPIGRE
jgi:hypothetical protein